jgi:hypothetical protein
MASDAGLSLDERIRRALAPLNGPLRIDSFLLIVQRERVARAQRSEMEARRSRQAASRERAQQPRKEAAAPPPAEPPRDDAAGEADADLNDSARLKAEVQAFLHRDEVQDVDESEVAGFMDFIGSNSLVPDDPAPEDEPPKG